MVELVDATDSKSGEIRGMSVRIGLGVPLFNKLLSIRIIYQPKKVEEIFKN